MFRFLDRLLGRQKIDTSPRPTHGSLNRLREIQDEKNRHNGKWDCPGCVDTVDLISLDLEDTIRDILREELDERR